MRLEVSPISFDEYKEEGQESSEIVKKRVESARERQRARFGSPKTNQEMTPKDITDFCRLDKEGEELIRGAQEGFSLSHRAVHKLLKVARTLADLEGERAILPSHLLEALAYREASLDASPPF